MPLPPRGDPARPLHLALRSTRALGAASVLFGLVFVLAFGYFNRYQRFRPYFIGIGSAAWFFPGVLYLLAAAYMKRGSRAAVFGAMAAAALQSLCAAGLLVASLTFEPVSAIPVLLIALWLAALTQLFFHLVRCLAAVRLDPTVRRGFDTIVPTPVIPVSNPSGTAAGEDANGRNTA